VSDSSPITIRAAVPADYDHLIGKVDQWWGGRDMAAMLPRLFFQHFAPWTYVAQRAGERLGFLCAFRSQSDDSVVYCHFIGVDPDARGLGIGEALYARLFVDAEAAGCREVHSVTSPRNSGSIAFHRRLGFEVQPGAATDANVTYTPDYDGPGEDRVRFIMRLDQTGRSRAGDQAIERG
jgi:ribosomal protein S18 acetylase RimI-like enzyme